jgi:hypothetical protein
MEEQEIFQGHALLFCKYQATGAMNQGWHSFQAPFFILASLGSNTVDFAPCYSSFTRTTELSAQEPRTHITIRADFLHLPSQSAAHSHYLPV